MTIRDLICLLESLPDQMKDLPACFFDGEDYTEYNQPIAAEISESNYWGFDASGKPIRKHGKHVELSI